MLQAPKTLAASALIPFVPRQVMLDSKASAAIESKIKEKEMEKESKKKKKKSKSSKQSETLENGSVAPTKGRNWQMLLSSIAAFLESSGFHKTLAVFRSETQLEGDCHKASPINFEELFYKFLESSKSHEEAAVNCQKENDSQKADDSSKEEIEHAHDASEHIHKKKRKHKKELDNVMDACATEHGSGSDKNINGSNLEKLKFAEDLHVGIKEKKKKKSVSDSYEESADKDNLEISYELTKESDKNIESKKKKKHKMSSDGGDGNTGSEDQKEKLQEIVEEKIVELKSLTSMSSSLSAESNVKNKGEKKKKKKTETSDSLPVNGNSSVEEALKEPDLVKEKTVASENGDSIEKKARKKRKRLDSEEKTSQDENATIAKDGKHVKLDDAENNMEWEAPHKPDESSPDNKQTTTSKKRKTEKSCKNSNEADKKFHQEQDPSGQGVQKEQLANDKLEKIEKEGGTTLKPQKKEKRSAEPKTVNAFQRVKIDEVNFADERLQDNSYWALDDTGSGYGAKAQEVLGQVRGRDFRHEKTKKKRGTYRGGQIDLQSHSIKFNYSDEE